MINKKEIESVIEGYLTSKNMFLVEIIISQDNDVEIYVEKRDGIVTIDNCKDINDIILNNFSRDDEDYSLTVSSGGLDLPFKVYEQYVKYTGTEVEVLLKTGIKERGILSGCSKEGFQLTTRKLEKIDGKKRKELVEKITNYTFDQIKYCKPLIDINHRKK